MQTPLNPSPHKANMVLNPSPYQLFGKSQSSDSFYFMLDLYAQNVAADGLNCFASIIKRYRSSLAYLNNDFKQSLNENLLDLLMLAVLWNEHKGRWDSSIFLKEKILSQLYKWRSTLPSQKERLDNLRGRLAQKWIDRPDKTHLEISLSNVKKLCLWLSATNEYNQEIIRLNSWISFLELIPETEVSIFLTELVEFGTWFKTESKKTLKNFTFGVDSFLTRHAANYKGKENYFFTGKKEVEYHLNMVGAAIMNRSMKAEFLETEHKVLLLPACMKKSKNCQAIEIMNGTVCRHCTPDCNISKASTEMLRQGVHTFIIKHSSGFSSYLKQWADQKRVGLIGTACTLNLLQGGFEMKRLHIPAQCIFLDYSGCQKHWNREGIPTNINLSQLKTMVETKASKAV